MTKTWIKAAGVRAVKTAAQTALAMIPVGVLSIFTSVAGLPEKSEESEEK